MVTFSSDIHCAMPSRRRKQVRKMKGSPAYRRKLENNVQSRLSEVVAASVAAETTNTEDIERGMSSSPGQSSGGARQTSNTLRSSSTLARVNRYAIDKNYGGDDTLLGQTQFHSGVFFAASSSQNSINLSYEIDMGSYSSPAWKSAAFTVRAETASAKRSPRLPNAPTPRIHKSNYRRAATIIRHSIRA